MQRVVTEYRQAHGRRALFVAFLCLYALLAGCGDPPPGPEEALRRWVVAAELAAENEARDDLLDMISPAYADARGNLRSDVNAMLQFYFLRQDNLELLSSIDDIRVIGDTAAEVEVSVALAGTNDSVLGFSANAYNFLLELERNGDDWYLISARWGSVGGALQ